MFSLKYSKIKRIFHFDWVFELWPLKFLKMIWCKFDEGLHHQGMMKCLSEKCIKMVHCTHRVQMLSSFSAVFFTSDLTRGSSDFKLALYHGANYHTAHYSHKELSSFCYLICLILQMRSKQTFKLLSGQAFYLFYSGVALTQFCKFSTVALSGDLRLSKGRSQRGHTYFKSSIKHSTNKDNTPIYNTLVAG